MRKYFHLYSILIGVILNILHPIHCNGQQLTNEFIKEDSMNLSILVLDFQTYEFLGGDVAYYPLCASCDQDSLPFHVEFMTPMDYGEILEIPAKQSTLFLFWLSIQFLSRVYYILA